MTRQPLENLCSRGYTVAGSPLAWTWAGDLMVRLDTRVDSILHHTDFRF